MEALDGLLEKCWLVGWLGWGFWVGDGVLGGWMVGFWVGAMPRRIQRPEVNAERASCSNLKRHFAD
jgi:hypothetical protein